MYSLRVIKTTRNYAGFETEYWQLQKYRTVHY